MSPQRARRCEDFIRPLVAGLKRECGVAHKNTAPGLGQRTVRHQARDHMFGSRDSLGAHLDPLRSIDTVDHTRWSIDLAIDPDLAVVIDVGLEKHSGVG
jgi:hypothetical protein